MKVTVSEIVVNVHDSDDGVVSAKELLERTGLIIPPGTQFEVDRKRLYEDNDGFEVEEVFETITYRRGDADTLPLTVIIYVHV